MFRIRIQLLTCWAQGLTALNLRRRLLLPDGVMVRSPHHDEGIVCSVPEWFARRHHDLFADQSTCVACIRSYDILIPSDVIAADDAYVILNPEMSPERMMQIFEAIVVNR